MSYFTSSFDDTVVRSLKGGGSGLIPSDTLYGLSCRALDEAAVKRLHSLKKRDKEKPFIVLISGVDQLEGLDVEPSQAAPALKYWPDSLTVVLEAPNSPSWLQMGLGTLAVRYPRNKELCDLIAETGPLVSTSANLQGGKPAADAWEARQYFGDELDFYVDAGRLAGEPSTIVKLLGGRLEVIRPGAVKISEKELL